MYRIDELKVNFFNVQNYDGWLELQLLLLSRSVRVHSDCKCCIFQLWNNKFFRQAVVFIFYFVYVLATVEQQGLSLLSI